MHHAPQINIKNKQPLKIVAFVFLLCFIIVLLLSEAVLLTHVNHEHDHLGANAKCATCAYLTAAGNLLKSLFAALAGAALTFGCFSAIFPVFKSAGFHTGFPTLIRLKTRLNN
ncbi:MAG: hypothetical protein FWD39_06700 [Clostridiales bacterium]|nr:hypothetical protein [Clostridiales bacterium]